MQKSLITILVAGLMAPALSFAEKGDIVVRARVTHVAPDESSHLDSSIGDRLEVNSNTIPEIDFSYYFTKNIAAELILAVGSRHDVNIGGSGANAGAKLGSINLLPPTLTAQWHFNPDQTIDPYVGAGMSYIRAMDRNLNLDTTGITVERNMFGPVLQAGADYNLPNKWLVNFDVKKIWFSTDVSTTTKIDNLDIDPWVVSFGVGKKF
ncbi:MAG: outer membrane beta-barrel protein [Limnohabitans sp.]|jgi:outer membrane protein|nr:outer membrane beta-barrel protein [Limnohabitans sp.]